MAQSVNLNIKLDFVHDDGAPLTEDELQKTAYAAYRAAFKILRLGRFPPALHIEVADVTADVCVACDDLIGLPSLAMAA